MKISRKGQVTIPVEIRQKLGLLPHTEVHFEVEGNAVRILREERPFRSRGEGLLAGLRGRVTLGLSTEEIMALTRSES